MMRYKVINQVGVKSEACRRSHLSCNKYILQHYIFSKLIREIIFRECMSKDTELMFTVVLQVTRSNIRKKQPKFKQNSITLLLFGSTEPYANR